MDVSPYFLAALGLGLPAYVLAVVLRRRRQAREYRQRAADCLSRAVSRTDGYNFRTRTGTDDLDGGDGVRDLTNVRKTGRRAIHRNHGGPRLGRYAAGRSIRGADAASLA